MTEHSPLIKISTNNYVQAVTIAADGEYLMSGEWGWKEGLVRVWRMEDGNQVAEMKTESWVYCLALSKDARWIAAGTDSGDVFVWNATTYDQVFKLHDDGDNIYGVDFSPDSTRLAFASNNSSTTVFDVVTRCRVLTLRHEKGVAAVKHSPQGDRIATVTRYYDSAVFIWDSNDGHLLIKISGSLALAGHNKGLFWSNNNFFVVSAYETDQHNAFNGWVVSRLPVPDPAHSSESCITLPQQEKFIVHTTKRTVTFWDTSMNISLALTLQQDILSIAISPDDRFLAIGGENGEISIHSLSGIIGIPDTISHASLNNSAPTPHATPTLDLREWAKAILVDRTWRNALLAADTFQIPRVAAYQVICEHLERIDRVHDSVECFQQMTDELRRETNLDGDELLWVLDSRQRLSKKLECIGDEAVDSLRHDEAVSHYTTALSLDPLCPQRILIKRCKVYVASGSWKQAVDDANHAITLDPSSPWGYELKHAALHKARDYENAAEAIETMLSKVAESPDQSVQQSSDQYISPSSTRTIIRKIVQQTIRHSPRVLIDTTTGLLHDRAKQASAFESQPIFNELVSSMTRRIDYVRIKREVRQYFRYVMLSHKWENNEPLFHQVVHIAVYDLDRSATHDKLQTFCKIVRDAGFNWAWSDTCCIDKSDHFILQEALVAMFKWYQGSAMMIVFLRGVHSSSQRGALVKSIWNTRAWTLQEYVASNIVHFYTEEWTLYQDLTVPNHKESSEVVLEMEQATGVPSQQLMALRPGLTSIREKLRLASTRETTLVEDVAYSLLGIFSAVGIPAIYGEGEASLGRLLANILTRSGDVSILAWTGESGQFNSCLPAHITVFNAPATSHLPQRIADVEMRRAVSESNDSSFDLAAALRLYDRLNELPTPRFAETRMTLPCIAFQLPTFSLHRTRSGRVFRADTFAFGIVEIKTRHDLSRMKSLYLVHPWLDTVLEREDVHGDAYIGNNMMLPPSPDKDDEEIFAEELDGFDDASSLLEPESLSPPALARVVPMDKETRAQRLVAHLRQPFGALLLAPTGRRAMDYMRVAADGHITTRFQDSVSLADILDNIRTLDVL